MFRSRTRSNHRQKRVPRRRFRGVETLETRAMLNAAPVARNDQYDVLAGDTLRIGVDLPPGLNAVATSADGHVYGIVIKTLNWVVARDEAAAMSYKGKAGHLVTFSSAAEQQFVLDQLVLTNPGQVNDVWIGFNDMAQEGQFRWVTNEPVTFTSWANNEPNNAGDEDAVEMYTNGKWNDITWGDGSTAYVVEFDGPFQTGILSNDTDADQDLLTTIQVTNVAHGALSLNADGSFIYTPSAGFSGTDSFTYRADDGLAHSGVRTVTFNVLPNSTPTAVDDSFEVQQFSTLSVGNRLPAGVTPVVWATNGHAYMQVNETLNWDQANAAAATWQYHGVAGHLITVTSSAENDFMLTRVMRRVNDEQYWLGMSRTEPNNTLEWVTGEPISFTAWGPGEPNNSGGLENGVELYPYYGNIWGDVPRSDLNFGYFVEFEPPFHGGVLKNDLDAEGKTLHAQLVTDAAHGELALADDGSFVYTPDSSFVGTDSFTYRASDGNTQSNIATATITVHRFNSAPQAVDDLYYAGVGLPRVVAATEGLLSNDSDAESDTLTVQLVAGPTHGALTLAADGSFTYLPNAAFAGVDTFTYRAVDFGLDSEIATVTINVAPSVTPPIARNDAYTLGEDETLTVGVYSDVRSGLKHEWKFDETAGNVAVDSAGDNDTTLFNWAAGQDKWTAGAVGGALDFNSVTQYGRTQTGIVSDRYTITFWLRVDALTGVNPRIASPWVTIYNEAHRGVVFSSENGIVGDMNPPHLGVWENYAIAFDNVGHYVRVYRDGVEVAAAPASAGEFTAPWVLGHNHDPNNQNDTLNGALDQLRIYDRLLSATEIAAISHAPSPLANDTAAYAPASAMDVQFEALTQPAHGTLTWAADGSFSYTPVANYHGPDSFQYRFKHDGVASNVATINLTVAPVNDAPNATADTFKITYLNQPLVVPTAGVLSNDSDVDGQFLSAVKLTNPQYGTLQLGVNGGFTYTAGASFVDGDSFQYRAFDGIAYSAPVTVRIEYDVPHVAVGSYTLLPDTPNQTIQILVTGGQAVSGLNLYAQVGDGGPERVQFDLPPGVDGPAITGIDLKTGTIFAGVPDSPQVTLAIPQVASAFISIAQPDGTVPAEGLLATITVDTTGFFGGEWDLRLRNVLQGFVEPPFHTDFAGIPAVITNGKLIIDKATITRREVLYGGSEFGDAPVPDKQVLLPGQTATFANYSSYLGGITAVAVEIDNALGTPTLADFAFYVGNANDTSTWQPAPAPTFQLLAGGGANGTDRIVLRWADGAITNKWLMVRIKSTINTGLAGPDVFYFGNAIGESGDSVSNAVVNATDVIATRDNPRGPFNPAGIDNRYDFNRDGLVNATDLVIARDHATSPLTALRLLTPNGSAPPPPPLKRSATPAIVLAAKRDAISAPAAEKRDQERALTALDMLFAAHEFAPVTSAKRRAGGRF